MAGRGKKFDFEPYMEQITQMALDNCHIETIAEVIGVPPETIRSRKDIHSFIVQKRAQGRTQLRRAQHETALSAKNAIMQIFLGKNELGQSDKHELTGEGGGPIQATITIEKTYEQASQRNPVQSEAEPQTDSGI